jgi:two-component system, LytTR family, sensor kinase
MPVAWAFAFWTAMGLFFAVQTYLLGDATVGWTLALRWAMPQWYAWGLLAPGIAVTERRIGRGRPIGTRLAVQIPLGAVWTLVAILMCLCVRPPLGLSWPASIWRFVAERFNWDLLIYGVIAGIAIARDYARQARDHERDVHRLQLESLALQQHLAEARLHSLRSQLQPHFLFNALNTMSALTDTDPKMARRLIEQLGRLLRTSLRHASTPLVTLAEELTFLDDYLAIETTRFEGRIAVSVQADDDTLDAEVPSFLLQPLVENAIRHGVGPRLSGGRIGVTVTRARGQLRLRVQDDGLGLQPDWRARQDAGVGLRNTAARLEQLYPGTHAFHVGPGASGTGVEVRLDVPWRQSRPAVVAGG